MDEEMKQEAKPVVKQEVKHIHHHDGGSAAGGLWFAGWLFFLAYTQPLFWKAVLGLIIWPYYLGIAARLIH
jgi:hypothetical protein